MQNAYYLLLVATFDKNDSIEIGQLANHFYGNHYHEEIEE